jgi:hypothetical protein
MKFEDIITKAGEGSEYQLSQHEREKMTRVVREYAAMKPLPHAQSYSVSLSYSWFTFAHRPIAAALVLVLVFGSGVSYAAENALPGDALYTVKTYINEPARVALATNAEAKAEVQIELAERRIEEAAVLAAEGRLDEETENELAVAFESHAAAVAEEMAEADKEDDSASIELASRFENRLAAHENILLEVESEGERAHTARLTDAIRAASENAITISAGTALAISIAADTAAAAEGTPAVTMEAGSEAGAEPAAMMTMSIASDTPVENVEVTTRAAKVFVSATAPAPSFDSKTVSRMKAAAEKSLKNAQKKFKGAKSLTTEAHEQAEADLVFADSLLTEGMQHLEADADAEAFAAFKESLRVSEQSAVYMKAAPTLEKARSRARNARTNVESRIESRTDATVEVGPINATVTLPLETNGRKNEESTSEVEDGPEPDDDGTSTESEVKIKLDLSL